MYDYNNPVFSPETGHFTQNVWRSSTHVGFGFGSAVDQYGKFWASYVVAKFFAPGNVEDEFEFNVLPPAPVTKTLLTGRFLADYFRCFPVRFKRTRLVL